jgi:hypothetical protein
MIPDQRAWSCRSQAEFSVQSASGPTDSLRSPRAPDHACEIAFAGLRFRSHAVEYPSAVVRKLSAGLAATRWRSRNPSRETGLAPKEIRNPGSPHSQSAASTNSRQPGEHVGRELQRGPGVRARRSVLALLSSAVTPSPPHGLAPQGRRSLGRHANRDLYVTLPALLLMIRFKGQNLISVWRDSVVFDSQIPR